VAVTLFPNLPRSDGALVWPLAAILLFEIVVTLTDFIEEDRTRRLPAGERVMRALMGIWILTFFASGVFASGLRDLAAQEVGVQ
jgi:hypothetical protein